ncbi:broad specificity phosphatase PhoE [Sphingomonas insulae]|uniref:Alpha-ribazole phosphatase n=1 Tax=Sphingomonas insulae TaxID=424800 RepID=A0ABN1HZM9_9SPHN|nr:histidine phosphatase family protein [Sphingomonas insulae]NIJ30692.1 broad specificity phosphatase PhoE [Sphingomonas insulae]
MTARVLIVRHTPVASSWSGRCYGRSDMGLSRAGTAAMRTLADELAAQSFATIVHSGAIRTRILAERIAALTGRPITADPRWLERDFGAWEGRSWHAIWHETGDLMDRMMTDPAGFHPGGGESGQDLATRVRAAWDALPTDTDTLVVSHGGPIAAIRTVLAGRSLERMIDAVPPCGSWLVLPR